MKIKLAGSTIQECVETLMALRRYKPFQYGGKLLVVMLPDGGQAFRSVHAVKAAMVRHGIAKASITTIQ